MCLLDTDNVREQLRRAACFEECVLHDILDFIRRNVAWPCDDECKGEPTSSNATYSHKYSTQVLLLIQSSCLRRHNTLS